MNTHFLFKKPKNKDINISKNIKSFSIYNHISAIPKNCTYWYLLPGPHLLLNDHLPLPQFAACRVTSMTNKTALSTEKGQVSFQGWFFFFQKFRFFFFSPCTQGLFNSMPCLFKRLHHSSAHCPLSIDPLQRNSRPSNPSRCSVPSQTKYHHGQSCPGWELCSFSGSNFLIHEKKKFYYIIRQEGPSSKYGIE